ncbi:MAG TPA: hypothetical protein PLW34_05420 [Termitinemataceae bacterium]|nr:hypothetical protein [Termitinemataceae bacterium]HOM23242.1 hypothetical protein [Termitinemataceae bacterium]HPQ00211.1 hypothetical protein [Termitinemataceae bacterium]
MMNNRGLRRRTLSVTVFFSAVMLAFMSCSPGEPADFSGLWGWEEGSDYFFIDLRQEEQSVIGFHSAVGGGGSVFDEMLAETPSLEGTVKGKTLSGTITDATNGVELPFKLSYLDADRLQWEITKKTDNAPFPQKVVLQKVTDMLTFYSKFQRPDGSIDYKKYRNYVKIMVDDIEETTADLMEAGYYPETTAPWKHMDEFSAEEWDRLSTAVYVKKSDGVLYKVSRFLNEGGALWEEYYFDYQHDGKLFYVKRYFDSEPEDITELYFYNGKFLFMVESDDPEEELEEDASMYISRLVDEVRSFVAEVLRRNKNKEI